MRSIIILTAALPLLLSPGLAARAETVRNAITSNAITSNALTNNALTNNGVAPHALAGSSTGDAPGSTSLSELNGVRVEGVIVLARPR